MPDMSVTDETSHSEMLPLKEVSQNMRYMSVTDEMFQLEMSPLKGELTNM